MEAEYWESIRARRPTRDSHFLVRRNARASKRAQCLPQTAQTQGMRVAAACNDLRVPKRRGNGVKRTVRKFPGRLAVCPAAILVSQNANVIIIRPPFVFLSRRRDVFRQVRSAPCALRHISQACGAFPACQKPQESARGGVLSHVHHFRRQVENPSGFQAGEIASCTSGTGRFLRRETPFSRAKTGESGRFCGFAKGKTVTGQIENARRGAQRGRYSPSTNLSKILF